MKGIPRFPAANIPSETHPIEAPNFFYCQKHLDFEHQQYRPPRPYPRRDARLCVRCGDPAEPLRDVVMMPAVTASKAEAHGVTVARLSTRRVLGRVRRADEAVLNVHRP